MEVKMSDNTLLRLTGLKAEVKEDEVYLSFKWPRELEQVYIYRRNLLEKEDFNRDKPYRKYTQSEYVRFGGFIDSHPGMGLIEYEVCPYVQTPEEAYLISSEEGNNRVQVMTRKIAIRYILKERKKLFSNSKMVQMQVFCEVDLPREALCYVKKKGSIPVNNEDGMQFQFISDFVAGDNLLPEIEVAKDEYVRIYLSDEVEHKEVYGIYKE